MQKILGIAIAIVFSIWGMILRISTLFHRELWLDELSQIAFTLGSFRPLWVRENPAHNNTAFPGDYLLTYPFVKLFGTSKMVAIPHALVTVLGFCLFYLICKRYLKTAPGYLIAFTLLCFNDFLIFHALEIRPYAVLPTLALACFYFAPDALGKEAYCEKGRFKRLLVGLLFTGTILFHLFGVYIVFFVVLFHLVLLSEEESFSDIVRRNRRFFGTIALIVLVPWVWYVSGIFIMADHGIEVFEYVPNPLVDFLGFSGALAGHFIGLRFLYFLLAGIVVIFLFRHKERFQQILFFITLITAPVLLVLISSIVKGYWFLPRQYIWVMPFFCFFIGWCWDSSIRALPVKIAFFDRQDSFE